MEKQSPNTTQKDGEEVRQAASESDASLNRVDGVTRGGRLWRPRKRQLQIQSGSALSSDDESLRGLMPTPGRKKDRRKEFLAPKPKQDTGKDIEEQVRVAEINRAAIREVLAGESDDRTAATLNKQVRDEVDIILNVATKSRNLKGTFQRALKDAAASIAAAVESLHKRSSTEETAKLQADNSNLHKELAELRKEITELREELAKSKSQNTSSSLRHSPPQREEVSKTQPAIGSIETEELTRSIMIQVGGLVSARFEALEERLLPEKRLRPPLAADTRNTTGLVTKTQSATRATEQVTEKEVKAQKKGKKGKGVPAKPNPKADSRSFPTAPISMEEGWTTVVKRGNKNKKAPKTTDQVPNTRGRSSGNKNPSDVIMAPKSTAQSMPVKLHAPRSSAIVITLQPGAEERGVTYSKVLAKARAEIDLPSCGITGLKFRTAATGARILEIPGATSGDKADALAQKLRDVLDEGEAKVSRPVKCAEMRISGLDDSITPQEIAAAVASRGGCPEEAVKVGEIRTAFQGTGAIWVRCPVPVAKKVSEGGRLLVGWVSAKVNLLVPRPMRCYRCLQIGHVRSQCSAEVDRSEECYRCGKPGHKVNVCNALPNCSLCAAANKPADHRLGSKVCSPPKPKKGTRAVTSTATKPVSAATSCPPTQTGEEEAMVVS